MTSCWHQLHSRILMKLLSMEQQQMPGRLSKQKVWTECNEITFILQLAILKKKVSYLAWDKVAKFSLRSTCQKQSETVTTSSFLQTGSSCAQVMKQEHFLLNTFKEFSIRKNWFTKPSSILSSFMILKPFAVKKVIKFMKYKKSLNSQV